MVQLGPGSLGGMSPRRHRPTGDAAGEFGPPLLRVKRPHSLGRRCSFVARALPVRPDTEVVFDDRPRALRLLRSQG